MLRFCDKEVCCISHEELDRGKLLSYFFQGNMDEMICVFNMEGTYRGRITYYSLINCDKAEDAVLEDYAILNKDFWKHARDFFVSYERSLREHVLLPVVDEEKQLISFAYEDGKANRELRMLKELEEMPGAISFAEIYPQYETVKICGFNELAFRFAEYLSKQNICVETDGELWERFFPDKDKAEVPDYKRLVIYAEGVHGGRSENWVENLLKSVSPEFECVDFIYEANWKEGIVNDTETDIVGLLAYLRKADKEIAILGTDMEAQNAYDFLAANGIEAQCFVCDIFEERQHLLFGKRVLKSAEICNRYGEMILLECQGENSALGVPILEKYSYMGFRRNRDLFLLKDYVEIPYHNLKHTLRNQSILFVGDILLCNRIAGYLKKNVEVGEMFFADALNIDTWGIYDNGILRQTELEDIDKDVLCLIVLPQLTGDHKAKIIADNDKRKQDIICILRKNGLLNYTDYFSYIRSFVELEKGIAEKGYKKEQFRPKKIILGAIGYNSGNVFVRGLLDNHPSILMMPNGNLLDNNLLWICVQLADVPAKKILPLFKSMYSLKDMGLCRTQIFEEKLEELLESGETFTSQELFVIFMIAYATMHGRKIDDVRNMMIYWEPHNMSAIMKETFVEWLGTEESLCGVLNVVRNICMVNGSMVKWGLEKLGIESLLKCNMSYPEISEKNQGGFERYVVRYEDLKLNPREKLSELCKYWEIPWSETLMEATEYGKKAVYDDGYQKIYDFDLKPVYNNYEEYFSSFDRFRFTLICSPWQKKYGYPYVETCGFSRRELQEMFLKEFRIEKEMTYNGEKGKLDTKIRIQERIRDLLWNVRKQELLGKYLKKIE